LAEHLTPFIVRMSRWPMKSWTNLCLIRFISSHLLFPPHKKSTDIADAFHRLEMVRLAISDVSDFMVSDVELNRQGPSYTIDTVKHFRSILPAEDEIYLLMGIDAFMEIDTWKSYRELFDLSRIIVMARPGPLYKNDTMQRHMFNAYLETMVSDGYAFSAAQSAYVHKEKHTVFICNAGLLDISSSQIRKLMRKGNSINRLVPDKVEEYIIKKGLYQ